MTNVTWVKDSGNGAVCYGSLPDGAYDEKTCILVSKQPSPAHRWDNVQKKWTLSLDDKKTRLESLETQSFLELTNT